jgi:hypothetical protein
MNRHKLNLSLFKRDQVYWPFARNAYLQGI